MGGLVIEKIRDGVEFTPDAAAAFRRADAQVRAELGRGIGVNSTYRDWQLQLRMYNAWQAYVNGRGPYPGHSKALHPDDPLAFHVTGEALDSDDWRNARIVQILAENGYIRNRLYVPNEEHHFEYIRAQDKNYGKPAGVPSLITKGLADMDKAQIIHLFTKGRRTWALIGATVPGGVRTTTSQETVNAWALIYGPSKDAGDQAKYDTAIAEARALAGSWLAQQKLIHG